MFMLEGLLSGWFFYDRPVLEEQRRINVCSVVLLNQLLFRNQLLSNLMM